MDKNELKRGEKLPKYKKDRIWVRSFETGRRWLDGVAADHSGSLQTEEQYARCLKLFCEWVGKNPDELIAEREEQIKSEDKRIQRKAEENLKAFCLYLKREKGISFDIFHSAVRSFYRYNYNPLMVRTPKTSFDTIKPVTIEDLRVVDMASDERRRFFIRFLKDSGMSREDAVEVTYGDIKSQFERGEQFIRINAKRRKEGINYETFIGPNTVDALKVYLRIRKNSGEKISDKTYLIATKRGKKMSPTTLTIDLMRLGKKVGVELSPHRLRKFFETYLSLAKIHPTTLKYWMGHKLSGDIEARYIIPPSPEQKNLYMEAYPKIDIVGEQLSEEERRIQATFDNLRLSGFSEEEIERYKAQRGKTWHTAKELILAIRQRARRPIPSDNANNADCADGKNCPTFKEIDECELMSYLRAGWKITHNLKNGRIIVQRE